MSRFNAILHFASLSEFVGGRAKTALIAATVAIAAALLGGGWHSHVYADSPPSASSRVLQPPDDASQALRRYTLQLLHILSDADANKWQRYRQAMPHCAAAPTYLAEIAAAGDASPIDAALIALTEDLCADLDQKLDEARTVGLLLNEPESMDGYTLIPGHLNNDVDLIDHLGRIAHSWQFESRVCDAKLLDNGNLLISLGVQRGGYYVSIVEVEPDGNIVWKYTHSGGKIHHDFLKMPNGNVLMIVQGIKTREEAIAAGANPDFIPSGGMSYDYLIEVRPTGSEGSEIVWEWSTWDYLVQDFDPSKLNYGDPSDHPELIDINYRGSQRVTNTIFAWNWWHINAIDYNPDLDQIMLSPRNHSELWIIDRSASTQEAPTRKGGNSGKGGALLYRWGNPRAYGHGMIADQQLFLQHHAQWIDPGLPGASNILIFNNGYEVGWIGPDHSSIEEIVPPVDGYGYRREPEKPHLPAEPFWSYTAEEPSDFYSRIMGCVQRLPNGNTLICDGTSGNLFQVTPNGELVWRYVYPMNGNTPLEQGDEPEIGFQLSPEVTALKNAVYRAYWYAPDHPGLQKYDLTPGDTIEIYE